MKCKGQPKKRRVRRKGKDFMSGSNFKSTIRGHRWKAIKRPDGTTIKRYCEVCGLVVRDLDSDSREGDE